MIKIALAQLNFQVGNISNNALKMVDAINQAKHKEVDIIVFSELSICGYPTRDFLTYNYFIQSCLAELQNIATHCTNITAIVGSPTINPKIEGKNMFNSACVLSNGKVLNTVNKCLLPTYDIFDEYRYFESNTNFTCIDVKGYKIALTVCEDLWDVDADKLYKLNPMDELIKQNPDLMINIAASPFDYLHREDRIRVFAKNCQIFNLPLFYTNQVGAQTEIIFDGGSLVLNQKGEVISELNYFIEDIKYFSFDKSTKEIKALQSFQKASEFKTERIYQALLLGIKDYFAKVGFKKAILGLSGGIDSAVVAVLATQALGPQNVKVLLMPSEYSSSHSITDAEDLAQKLGIEYEILPIKSLVTSFTQSLASSFASLPQNVTEENIQARVRGTLLMAHSNKFGHVLLNTTNKSEAAVGYGTLYGDMCGGLAILGDVYKMEVYELAKFINRNEEIIPINSIIKPPSAELRPNQKDSDSLPDYAILDKILHAYIEQKLGPDEIIALGFDKELVNKTLAMVNRNEFKRFQMAPILRVSPKAFGMGRRMPLEGKYVYS